MASIYAGFWQEAIFDDSSRLVKSEAVFLYAVGTTTPVTRWTSKTKAVEDTAPLATDIHGNLTIFAEPGDYDLLCRGRTTQITIDDHPSELAAQIANRGRIMHGTEAAQPAASNFDPDTIYWQTDVNDGTPQITVNGTTWQSFAAAGHHAERHLPGHADPIDYAAAGVELTTNKNAINGYAGLDGSQRATTLPSFHAVEHGILGPDPITIAEQQIAGYREETVVPLGASDTFVGAPLLTTGNLAIYATAISDVDFSIRLDTSPDGITFSNGTPVSATAFSGGFYAKLAELVPSVYVRVAIINDSTAQTSLKVFTRLSQELIGVS